MKPPNDYCLLNAMSLGSVEDKDNLFAFNTYSCSI